MAMSGKKALIGCAIGCGGLVLLVIAAIVAFTFWLNTPGTMLEPQTLLGSDTRGYVEWSLSLDDPGTEGFAREMIRTMQELPEEAADELPPFFVNWIRGQQAAKTEKDIMNMFPAVLAWTVQPGEEGGDDLHLLTFSNEKLGNRLVLGDWFLGFIFGRTGEVEVHRHRDEKIYRIPFGDDRHITLFLRNANVFFTNDLETAMTAVDRMLLDDRQREPTELDRLFAETDQGGTLRGAVTNRQGELARLRQLVAGDEPVRPLWNELEGMTLRGGATADGSLELTLQLLAPDAGWIDENLEALTQSLAEVATLRDIEPELEVRPDGDRVVAELRIPQIVERFGDWRDRQVESRRGTVKIKP